MAISSNTPEVFCHGKKRIGHYALACQVARNGNRRRKGERRHAYHCSACKGWHVGTSTRSEGERQRASGRPRSVDA